MSLQWSFNLLQICINVSLIWQVWRLNKRVEALAAREPVAPVLVSGGSGGGGGAVGGSGGSFLYGGGGGGAPNHG